ncbi:glutamate formimidoyltransferase [Acidaminobacter sp.]|uniref:glutamate formimidoyltransferase n=1 Tax=Acidaminobacter sp. TaxID=1872102 RepID=UPI00138177C6|nr:glutamate formimidoyltransferase [Acidaminobacter sp.]MDK9712214.1 glutamate formimidoyltransferase [Acidaminobacter sp.]MZQ96291.1 glutamate formimidoyltransferase [Acidaminobacter sp.]
MKVLLAEVNVSEGRDLEKIAQIKEALISNASVRILEVNSDKDHNRTVFTYSGEPAEVLEGTKRLTQKAVELIDMTVHTGAHPRMGAVDVVPFIPARNVSQEEALEVAKAFGKFLGGIGVPVYYYEDAATRPERKSLVDIRKGEYESFKEKMTKEEWRPDEGPFEFVPKSGATVTGVRFPLIAFNVNLRTDDLAAGKQIVKAVRAATGGYQNVRAIALEIPDKKMVQISMNLTQYQKTPIHRVFETIKSEADSRGILIADTELVGPVPVMALEDLMKFYVRCYGFNMEQLY